MRPCDRAIVWGEWTNEMRECHAIDTQALEEALECAHEVAQREVVVRNHSLNLIGRVVGSGIRVNGVTTQQQHVQQRTK